MEIKTLKQNPVYHICENCFNITKAGEDNIFYDGGDIRIVCSKCGSQDYFGGRDASEGNILSIDFIKEIIKEEGIDKLKEFVSYLEGEPDEADIDKITNKLLSLIKEQGK